MIPEKLYHATYAQFLNSIKTNGLGNTKNKMWTDSKQAVVYLADDPWVAESYAEESEWIYEQEDPDAYLDNIIILEITANNLDKSKLKVDKNVILDDGEENATWEYHGIIPWEACKIFDANMTNGFKESLTEELDDYDIRNVNGHLEAYKNGKFVCSGKDKQELADGLEEIELEVATKSKFELSFIVVNGNSYERKVKEVEAENERAALDMITDKNAYDIKVVKLESVSTSFADDFQLYENLWD